MTEFIAMKYQYPNRLESNSGHIMSVWVDEDFVPDIIRPSGSYCIREKRPPPTCSNNNVCTTSLRVIMQVLTMCSSGVKACFFGARLAVNLNAFLKPA